MNFLRNVDWALLAAGVVLSLFGILSMYNFGGENAFAPRQTIWLAVAVAIFFLAHLLDWRFLRRTPIVVIIYGGAVGLLALLFAVGSVVNGAQSWLHFGVFAVEPGDFANIALIVLLSKYFSRRHIEIARLRHLVVSGAYAFIVFILVFLQPDFGGAIIVLGIWLGMILLAGIPFRYVLGLLTAGAVALSLLWTFGFADYQKARIMTFIHPLADIQGAGYNAFQSTVAVGSGGLFGKGIGYGTQSRLQFLPEHETDFIFAAFVEEWGLGGAILVFCLLGIVLWRITRAARVGATNFETLFALGVALLFVVRATIHIGMNIGLLPVTGTTLPFMSYGGSHLVTEYFMLGIVSAMRRYGRTVRADAPHDIVGAVV